MSTNVTWKKQCTIGDIGEKWFYDYITIKQGFTVIPTGKDEYLGIKSKIDFICMDSKKRVLCWEVKTDTKISKTGNMFVECFDDKAKLSLGWLYTTKSNYMCYIDYTQKKMYFFAVKALREYVDKHDLRKATCYDKASDGSDREIEREGFLANINSFKQWCYDNSHWFEIDNVIEDTKEVA